MKMVIEMSRYFSTEATILLIPSQKIAKGKSPSAAAMFLDVPICKEKVLGRIGCAGHVVVCEYSVSEFANCIQLLHFWGIRYLVGNNV